MTANRNFRVFRRTECTVMPGVILGLVERKGVKETPAGTVPDETRYFMFFAESELKKGESVELPSESLGETTRTFVNDDGEEKSSNWLYWKG